MAESGFRAWAREHEEDPAVWEWLDSNPPPDDFAGEDLEWAYLEMPKVGLGTVLVAAAGAAALVGLAKLAAWLKSRRREEPPAPTG